VISEYAPFFVIGIATGSIYAIAAMGLVLTYKTSGIFNFGHGAVGAAAAFLFYDLHVRHGIPWPIASVLAVVVFGAAAGLLLELLARGLAGVAPAMKVVGTLGILLAVQGMAVVIFGSSPINLKQFLPDSTFKLGGVFVGYNQLIAALLAALSAVGLSLFFKLTKTGTQMRAVVDDPDLLDITGTSPVRIRRTAWVLGSVFASLAGVLIAPLLSLDATLLTLLVVQAFGAAAIGRFTSLPLTYAGGLLLGVLRELVGKWVGTSDTFSSLPAAVPFLLLFVVLLLSRKGTLPDFGTLVRSRVPERVQVSRNAARVRLVLVLAVALAVPAFAGTKTILYATGMVYVGVFLSLGLLVRLSGQVSLCQVGFMGLGAAFFGQLTTDVGMPWLLALVLAGVFTVPFGALVAVPAIRLSGIYLALATFGYGILLDQIVFRTNLVFGSRAVVFAKRPVLFGIDFTSDTGYYYLVLIIALVLAAGIAGIERARLGRLLRALGDSPIALSTQGATINITRLLVFCLASFVAGIAGALYVPLFGSANGDTFTSFLSLILLTVFAVAGRGAIRPAFIASLLYIVGPGYGSSGLSDALPAIFGIAAILVAVYSNGGGPSSWFARLGANSEWRLARSPVTSRTEGAALVTSKPIEPRLVLAQSRGSGQG
jgi:branched-subunit amino acid ABC-type transport system permease component